MGFLILAGQNIATWGEVTPNGRGKESIQTPLGSGLGIIFICPVLLDSKKRNWTLLDLLKYSQLQHGNHHSWLICLTVSNRDFLTDGKLGSVSFELLGDLSKYFSKILGISGTLNYFKWAVINILFSFLDMICACFLRNIIKDRFRNPYVNENKYLLFGSTPVSGCSFETLKVCGIWSASHICGAFEQIGPITTRCGSFSSVSDFQRTNTKRLFRAY